MKPNRIDRYLHVIKGWREFHDGRRYYFRSKWEINFAHYLEWLKQGHNILDWWYEPDVFWFKGIKRGVTNYKPDFKVMEVNGAVTWYEVKGYMDAASQTKIRRMAKYHPDVKLVVIGRAEYGEIMAKCGKLFGAEE